MSVLQSTAIQTAIEELLEGSIGTTRRVPAMLFESDVFDGQPTAATQAKAYDPRWVHRFDVVVGRQAPHGSTPLSVKSAHRNATFAVTINLVTRLPNTSAHSKRKAQRARIAGDVDTAIAALSYPGNLTETQDHEATGIISGMLLGPDGGQGSPVWEPVEENWPQHLYRSRITASAIVQINQAVA
jgi:hypothetical protein